MKFSKPITFKLNNQNTRLETKVGSFFLLQLNTQLTSELYSQLYFQLRNRLFIQLNNLANEHRQINNI